MSVGPVVRVSLEATAAMLLAAIVALPVGALAVVATGWGLPPESNPFATVETVRFREVGPEAGRSLVERLRRARPNDRIEFARNPDGTVTIRRIGSGGMVLLPEAGRTPGISRLEASSGPLWVESIVPYLPDVSPEAPAAEQVAALVRGALRFLDESGDAPAMRGLRRAVRLAIALLLGATSLCFLLLGAVRLRRGAVGRPLRWGPPVRLAALGLAGGGACLAAAFAVEWLSGLAGLSIPEQPFVEAVFSTRDGAFLAAGFLVLLAPFSEELFFRGYVFRYLSERSGRTTAYAVSVLLFAGMHLHPVALIVYGLYGAAFAWLTERTDSIVPSTVAHVTVNAAALLTALS